MVLKAKKLSIEYQRPFLKGEGGKGGGGVMLGARWGGGDYI